MLSFSPVTQRRWAQFKANKRGYWSLWIFLVLFVVAMSANLIANSKPLLVDYKGSTYVPFLKSYPETLFGGELETEADYRDPYVAELIK
ncbi:MAG TPA: ABC transporter permease, partial [Alphaproteobacteria bacterium]|nr:ABC transporter permease [Alphaproteobacteria bacterium]